MISLSDAVTHLNASSNDQNKDLFILMRGWIVGIDS